MKQKILKRGIALFCAFMLVVTAYVPPVAVSAEDTDAQSATEQITVADMGSEYTRVTFSSFGLDDQTVTTAEETVDATIDGNWRTVLFHGTVTFSTDSNARLCFGHKETYGVNVYGSGEDLVVDYLQDVGETDVPGVTIDHDVVGKTLTGTPLDIALSIEQPETGTVKVGFFIDGNLYNNEFITFTDVNSDYLYMRHLRVQVLANSLTIASNNLGGEKEPITLADLGYEYTRVTFSDFGLDGQKVQGSTSIDKTIEGTGINWDHVLFHGLVTFSTNSNDRICLGHNETYGVNVYGSGENLIVSYDAGGPTVTIDHEIVGKTLTKTPLNIAIAMDRVNLSSTAGIVRVGLFIDGELYNNEYITFENINAEHLYLRHIHVQGPSDGITFASSELGEVAETLTLSHLNIKDNDNLTSTAVGTYTESLLNKKISMLISANEGNYLSLLADPSSGWGGVQWGQHDGHGMVTFEGTEQTAWPNLSSYYGNLCLLEWIVQTADFDYDGKKDDLMMCIWVNKSLLNESRINGEDCGNIVLGDLYKDRTMLGIHPSGGTAMKIYSYEEKEEWTNPDVSGNLRHMTLDDFGIPAGNVSAEAGKTTTVAATMSPVDNFMNTTMAMRIVNTEGSSHIHYATLMTNHDQGIRFEIQNNSIKLVVVGRDGSEMINDSLAVAEGLLAQGEEYTLSVQLSRVVNGTDTLNNDALLKIFINDTEVFLMGTSQSTVLADMADVLGNSIAIVANPSASTESGATITVSNPQQEATQFEEFTGVIAGVYSGEESTSLQAGKDWTDLTLDGKMFTTNVRFNSKHSQLFYGGATHSSWAALQIGTIQPSSERPQDHVFTVVYPSAPFAFTRIIDAGIAGVQLKNKTFKLGISTRVVDANGDDIFDDLEIGIWFNDKLYNNSYIYLTSREDSEGNYRAAKELLQASMSVRCASEAGKVILGDVTAQSSLEQCIDTQGFYFADSDTTVSVKDGQDVTTTYEHSATLSKPGNYEVTYTDGNSTFTDSVFLYAYNDVTEDGKVNIKDLVAWKRYMADDRAIGDAAMKGIHMEDAANFDEAAYYTTLVDVLLDSHVKAKEISDSVMGETGAGTYITSLGVSQDGTSVIGIADKEDAPYYTETSKFMDSGLDYVLDFDTERNINVLQITDTQIMPADTTKKGMAYVEAWNGNLKDELDALISQNKPDLILLTGDITYGQFDDEEGTMFKAVIELMESYKIPWAPIFGNHEQETPLGTAWMCEQLMNAPYCLFNRRNEIGGNGNYSIGLAINGTLKRSIFMMDSRCCWAALTEELNSGVANQYVGFTDEQIGWYRTVAASVNACANEKINSLMCFHIPASEVATASMEKGYQLAADNNATIQYDLGTTPNENGDFGFKQNKISGTNTSMGDYIYSYLQAAGTDGVFSGHQHHCSLSINWKNIRWTFGLKTGGYEGNPGQTGGTLITIRPDTTFDVEHKPITDRVVD